MPFHAKVSKDPTIPGNVDNRKELLNATRLLGRLYVELSRLITGAGFAGSAMTYAAFEGMMQGQAGSPLYVSEEPQFNMVKVQQSSSELITQAGGHPAMHQLIAKWDAQTLPATIRRVGSLVNQNGVLIEAVSESVDIETVGTDSSEFVIQTEFASANNLRDWYL